ncbi:HEPN domain-containing protein [Ferrimicrobium acidiphilum]|uniref:HEPN domain-containing protein n=1 Tax=Ferrimicrobium acidiphilum TaxID=121039 RepID=UPI0023F06862|nr:HEPN domain-containing protein [Ferrimicrobium acidiphilum]
MTASAFMSKAIQAAASARALLDRSDTDGACNRAYYAVFNAACAALLAAGYEVGKTHSGVLNAFHQHLVRTGEISKDDGQLLKRIETFRYIADYSENEVDWLDAEEMVLEAERFVTTLQLVIERPEPTVK